MRKLISSSAVFVMLMSLADMSVASEFQPSQGVIDLNASLDDMDVRIHLDKDSDSFTTAQGDCDDTDASTYPGASEITDGIDNNCDGIIDR